MTRKSIFELIKSAAEDSSPELTSLIEEQGVDARLFGQDSVLDSLGLVSLIVLVESLIEEEYGVAFVLADDRAMSQANSPFRTVGSLADYAALLLEETDVTDA